MGRPSVATLIARIEGAGLSSMALEVQQEARLHGQQHHERLDLQAEREVYEASGQILEETQIQDARLDAAARTAEGLEAECKEALSTSFDDHKLTEEDIEDADSFLSLSELREAQGRLDAKTETLGRGGLLSVVDEMIAAHASRLGEQSEKVNDTKRELSREKERADALAVQLIEAESTQEVQLSRESELQADNQSQKQKIADLECKLAAAQADLQTANSKNDQVVRQQIDVKEKENRRVKDPTCDVAWMNGLKDFLRAQKEKEQESILRAAEAARKKEQESIELEMLIQYRAWLRKQGL